MLQPMGKWANLCSWSQASPLPMDASMSAFRFENGRHFTTCVHSPWSNRLLAFPITRASSRALPVPRDHTCRISSIQVRTESADSTVRAGGSVCRAHWLRRQPLETISDEATPRWSSGGVDSLAWTRISSLQKALGVFSVKNMCPHPGSRDNGITPFLFVGLPAAMLITFLLRYGCAYNCTLLRSWKLLEGPSFQNPASISITTRKVKEYFLEPSIVRAWKFIRVRDFFHRFGRAWKSESTTLSCEPEFCAVWNSDWSWH